MRQEYELAYMGVGRKVPSSRWGAVLTVLEAMHWTYQEYLEQPFELIMELTVRLAAQDAAARRAADGRGA